MNTYHYRSHAKINLTLEIIAKLSNGYHELRTVMMRLPHLYDEIDVIIHDDPGKGINISCNDQLIPTDERNICSKIFYAFCEKSQMKCGLEITLKKNIPTAAGMGGGSSNGAVILQCLNVHFEQILSYSEMIDVASSVGKDIPFFLTQKNAALVEGMGERLTEEFDMPHMHILVVNPRIEISTPQAFGRLAEHLWFMTDVDRFNHALKMRDVICNGGDVASYLYNDFEIPIFEHYPAIARARSILRAYGAQGALMSGSGSTVFGIFDSKKSLMMAHEKICKKYPNYFVMIG